MQRALSIYREEHDEFNYGVFLKERPARRYGGPTQKHAAIPNPEGPNHF